jgi:hypothetical protein
LGVGGRGLGVGGWGMGIGGWGLGVGGRGLGVGCEGYQAHSLDLGPELLGHAPVPCPPVLQPCQGARV